MIQRIFGTPGEANTRVRLSWSLQVQLENAMPSNRGLPDTVVRINVGRLREIPPVSRVGPYVTDGSTGRSYEMPGGGEEMQFQYQIPPEFIEVEPIPVVEPIIPPFFYSIVLC